MNTRDTLIPVCVFYKNTPCLDELLTSGHAERLFLHTNDTIQEPLRTRSYLSQKEIHI